MPRTKRQLTPQALFDYAVAYCQAQELAGNGSCHPTFRAAARHFRVNLAAIQDTCDDWQGPGYMVPAVGGRTGAGHYTHAHQGDHQIEAYP